VNANIPSLPELLSILPMCSTTAVGDRQYNDVDVMRRTAWSPVAAARHGVALKAMAPKVQDATKTQKVIN
jgi:hypothetical protein